MYDYGYGYDGVMDATINNAGLGGLFIAIMIFSMIIALIGIISYAKIFKKAGKDWWASIIPVYNYVVMIQIAKLSMIYLLLFFVPFANIYAIFKINIEIAKKFGKTSGFGIGMVFIPIIFVPLLAFSDNSYEDSQSTVNSNQQFDANRVINNENSVVSNVGTSVENIGDPGLEVVTPVAPIITPVENSVVSETEPTVNNNITNETENIQPVVNNEPINEIPIAPIEPINVNENNNVTENVVDVNQTNAFNIPPLIQNNEKGDPIVETTMDNQNNQLIEEPVVENNNIIDNTIVIDPVIVNDTNQVNAFNVPPVMENQVNNETIPTMEPTMNVQNNIEQSPIVEPVIVNDIETLNNDSVVQNNDIPMMNESVNEQKKVCKNCGTEMPDIVSICPNCGTDNE